MRKVGQLSISVLILYYMWFNERYGHNALIVYGSFILMAVCFFVEVLQNGSLDAGNFHFGIWTNLVMVVYSLVPGLLVAYNQTALLESIKLILQYSVIVMMMYYYAQSSESGIDWILITMNIGALLCAYNLLTSPVEVLRGRYAISYSNNPNTLGFVLVLGVLSIMLRFKPEMKWMLINVPQIVMFSYGIIMTGSRKCILSVLIIAVIFALETLRFFHHNLTAGNYFILLAGFAVILVILGRNIWSFYRRTEVAVRMQDFLDDESNGNRLLFYRVAWSIFKQKPIFGGGLDQFKYWSHIGAYAHSTYAEAISDFGVIGSIIYFSPIIVSGKQAFSRVFLNYDKHENFKERMILALWIMEIFMGIGQIFFLDIMHYLAWTIIYFHVQETQPVQIQQESRYIK